MLTSPPEGDRPRHLGPAAPAPAPGGPLAPAAGARAPRPGGPGSPGGRGWYSYILLFLLLTMGDTTWTRPGAAGSALCPLAPALLAPSLLTVDTQPDPAAISILYIHQCNCL